MILSIPWWFNYPRGCLVLVFRNLYKEVKKLLLVAPGVGKNQNSLAQIYWSATECSSSGIPVKMIQNLNVKLRPFASRCHCLAVDFHQQHSHQHLLNDKWESIWDPSVKQRKKNSLPAELKYGAVVKTKGCTEWIHTAGQLLCLETRFTLNHDGFFKG